MAIASQALDVSEVAVNSPTPVQLSLEVKLVSPGLPFRLHGALDFLSSHAEAVVKSGHFYLCDILAQVPITQLCPQPAL